MRLYRRLVEKSAVGCPGRCWIGRQFQREIRPLPPKKAEEPALGISSRCPKVAAFFAGSEDLLLGAFRLGSFSRHHIASRCWPKSPVPQPCFASGETCLRPSLPSAAGIHGRRR